MLSSQGKLVLTLVIAPWFLGTTASARQTKRSFTVADDIGLTLFATQGGGAPELHFSPDGKYFAVWTERGILKLNCVEDSIRIYRSEDVKNFLDAKAQAAQPVWILALSGNHHPVIGNWHWLGNSSGIAFLRPNAANAGKQELVLADLRKRRIVPLTASPAQILAFDVRDAQRYVYVVADHSEWEKNREEEARAAAYVGTGKSLSQLLFPDDPLIRQLAPATKELWAILDGKRFQVKHNETQPDFQELSMALSPDGKWLATIAPVEEVPTSWETLYPAPPFLSYGGGGIRPQHPIAAGHGTANQFVRIDLKSGAIESLADAPSMDSVGIFGGSGPAWSNDGREVLLPGTFLKASENHPDLPCVAIVDLGTKVSSCVAPLKEGYTQITDPGDNYHTHADMIVDARFAGRDNRRVLLTFDTRDASPGRTEDYRQDADGRWQKLGETLGAAETGPGSLQVRIKESFQEAPLLMASNESRSRVLWDPNPKLKELELGEVSLYKWKSADGREWKGGLYKPVGYEPGRRYPLVIQTHGFVESQYLPSGLMSTAFAAREMAAAGIMVLQTVYGDPDCEMGTVDEGPCEVRLFEAAVKQLTADGLADPEKIGIIGFSRTCYYVMEALTTNTFPLKAASVTDGLMADYLQYAFGGLNEEFEKLIGAKPFAEGLQEWMKRSPGFNLEKVTAPLLVNATRADDILFMWLPYAGLHYLKKPVDLIVLNTEEHVLTNPAVRVASQGGSVDWFRFWLQGYEDPDSTKAEQYKRWRGLRKLQEENGKQRDSVTKK